MLGVKELRDLRDSEIVLFLRMNLLSGWRGKTCLKQLENKERVNQLSLYSVKGLTIALFETVA